MLGFLIIYAKGLNVEFKSNTIKIRLDVRTATPRGLILKPGRSSSKYLISPAPVEGIGALSFLPFGFLNDIFK